MSKNENLPEVTFEQANRLRTIGFDWNCDKAFDENGEEVNWTTKQFYCWKPTIALAFKFFKDRFGIIPSFHGRHMGENGVAYSVAYILVKTASPYSDLSDYLSQKYEEDDGVLKMRRKNTFADYDTAEVIALDTLLNFLELNFKEDFYWMKKGKRVKFKNSEDKGLIIHQVDNVSRMIQVSYPDGHIFWQYFHKFESA